MRGFGVATTQRRRRRRADDADDDNYVEAIILMTTRYLLVLQYAHVYVRTGPVPWWILQHVAFRPYESWRRFSRANAVCPPRATASDVEDFSLSASAARAYQYVQVPARVPNKHPTHSAFCPFLLAS